MTAAAARCAHHGAAGAAASIAIAVAAMRPILAPAESGQQAAPLLAGFTCGSVILARS